MSAALLATVGASLTDNLVGLALTGVVIGYLVLVLMFPERF